MAPSKATVRSSTLPHPARLYRLLGQVADFYQRRFAEEPRARKHLLERGIESKETLEAFHVGYCDGTLRDVLPFDEKIDDDLRTLGVLTADGKECFAECAVFPLWSFSGVCIGLYGWRLFESEVRDVFLPGPRRGLINWQAAKRNTELLLCGSVLDAVSLYEVGQHNAVPCYGAEGFTEDHADMLRRFRPKRIAVCAEGEAASMLVAKVENARPGSETRIITPPTSAHDLLAEHGANALREAMQSPAPPSAKKAIPPKVSTQRIGGSLILQIQDHTYEVKAISRRGTQLRATLKASRPSASDRFELATIDLYSKKSREWFGGLCGALFEVDDETAQSDMRVVLSRVEQAAAEPESTDDGPHLELTDAEREEAMKLLRRPDLMEQMLRDFELVGYSGEVLNKQLGYLVAVSRNLDRPLSLLIESRSGAGKSALQDAVLAFVPNEEFLKYSRITDQALFYKAEEGLEGKLLVIEEATGMGGSAYSIRALQSGEELRVAATGKDPTTGKLKTEEYVVKARTAVMMTTTNPDFDEETKSRFISTTVNESAELTAKILEVQRQAETVEGLALAKRSERIRRVHQNAQRLLESVTVANPYAPQLTFPSTSLMARRDNKKYLGLIRTVTLLHQHQRPKKQKTMYGETIDYIEVTLEDIAIANRIASSVLSGDGSDVTPQARRLFGLIREMLINGSDAGEKLFSRRQLREHTGWSDWQVRTHLGELVELEYLHVQTGKNGTRYVYELSDTHLLEALPGFGLTEVEALRASLCADKPRWPQRSRRAASQFEGAVR